MENTLPMIERPFWIQHIYHAWENRLIVWISGVHRVVSLIRADLLSPLFSAADASFKDNASGGLIDYIFTTNPSDMFMKKVGERLPLNYKSNVCLAKIFSFKKQRFS